MSWSDVYPKAVHSIKLRKPTSPQFYISTQSRTCRCLFSKSFSIFQTTSIIQQGLCESEWLNGTMMQFLFLSPKTRKKVLLALCLATSGPMFAPLCHFLYSLGHSPEMPAGFFTIQLLLQKRLKGKRLSNECRKRLLLRRSCQGFL